MTQIFLEEKLSMYQNNCKKSLPLLITTGEPAGIGMDIVLMLASQGKLSQLSSPVVVLADNQAMLERLALLNKQGDFCQKADFQHQPIWHTITQSEVDELLTKGGKKGDFIKRCLQKFDKLSSQSYQNDTAHIVHKVDFILIDIPCETKVQAGRLEVKNAKMVFQQLTLAHHLASTEQVSAIITAPLQKSVLIEANLCLPDGSMFCGHTEFFMQQSGCQKVVMMLANSAMKVALVTTHLPLKDVPSAITMENVRQTVQIVLQDMMTKFKQANPKILVCGLNPHAGENGHLGDEEINIINPVLQTFQQQGVDISDAMPADTLFTTRHLTDCDVVISMYHDQGLPVLKSHGFGDTVNLTLGLPYIRTSVDHGTALDLAGTGKASASSLYQALLMADDMVNNKSVTETVL